MGIVGIVGTVGTVGTVGNLAVKMLRKDPNGGDGEVGIVGIVGTVGNLAVKMLRKDPNGGDGEVGTVGTVGTCSTYPSETHFRDFLARVGNAGEVLVEGNVTECGGERGTALELSVHGSG